MQIEVRNYVACSVIKRCCDFKFFGGSFSKEEIKVTLWSCESSNSPGLDGKLFSFLKEFCDTIGSTLVAFLEEVHENGKNVKW